MACQSTHEDISGFQPLVDRLHSFSTMEDNFEINKMKDSLQVNIENYQTSCNTERNNGIANIESNNSITVNDDTASSTVDVPDSIPSTSTNNSANNSYHVDTNGCNYDELQVCTTVNMDEAGDVASDSTKRNEDGEKVEDGCEESELFIDDGGSDAMSDSYTINEQVSYTKDMKKSSERDTTTNGNSADNEAVHDNGDLEDENTDSEFAGLQKDNGIYTGSRKYTNSEVMVSECDSTSAGSDLYVERISASEIANSSIQLGDNMCEDAQSKSSNEISPKRDRWTMKIKVGNASDGSRCEIIKQLDYEEARKGGLIRDDSELLAAHSTMQASMAEANSSLYSSLPPSEIKMLVGKRKKEKKVWKEDEIFLTDLGTPAKKAKNGLRSDCPPFCKTNCTKIHHPLLVSARRMIENDSNTTIMFLEQVARFYGGDLGQMTPATEIQDPWKDTSYPLLHYLALMGKCSGCFALVDAGQTGELSIASNGDSVVHTLVREMYNFNCTHGHMDILLKKFTILLKEFRSCLLIENYMRETPFHLLGKLISGTSLLLNVPGRNKLPYRLYQFGKNMLLACLEQYVDDKLDSEVLNRQDTLGNTMSHYVAQDRASHALLQNLLEKGADFTILNESQQNVEDMKLMAPPAPDSEILELAEFSAKSNKYKKENKKNFALADRDMKKEYLKRELTAEQTTDNFMEMLNTKLSTMSEWEPIENLKTKKKPEKKSRVSSLLSAAATLEALPPFEEVAARTGLGLQNTVSSVPLISTSASIPDNSSTAIADVTSASTFSSTVFVPEVVKVEKPDDPGYAASSNPVSDISIIDKLCNLSNSMKSTTTAVVTPTVVTSSNQTYPPRLSHIAVPNASPVASVPPAASNMSYPVISSMQNLARDVSMQNLFMFRPHGPPVLTQHSQASMMNQNLQPIVPRPPVALQASGSTGATQPLLLKTGDGKLMSFNVVPVSKPNTQVNNNNNNNNNSNNNNNNNNTSWNQQTSSMPLLNVNPQVPPQRPQFIAPTNLRYITPSMVNNSFRPPDPTSLNIQGAFTNPAVQRLQHPTLLPNNMMPQSYQGGGISMSNITSMQNHSNILSHSSLIQQLMTGQSINTAIQNTLATSKYDPKKTHGLEASIENLRYSAMNSAPNITNKNKNLNKSRLGASVKGNGDDSAPPVIILDEVSAGKTVPDTRELQSPSIESSQDPDSPQFRDVDGFASFMKNYLQEKGSIDDFVKFSNEKKDGLMKQLEEERRRIQDINSEISIREADIKGTREQVVGKEMEIAHLRLKLTKLQNDINQLRNNRDNISDTSVEIEKRMKTLEEQTALFTSWNHDSRSDR